MDHALAALPGRQAIEVLSAVVGELAENGLPERVADQLAVIADITGAELRLDESAAPPDQDTVAEAVLVLLRDLGDQPDAGATVRAWVADPPRQEAAAFPLELSLPLVITGCLILLNVAGHLHVKYKSGAGWEVKYAPDRKAPLDSAVTRVLDILARFVDVASTGRGSERKEITEEES